MNRWVIAFPCLMYLGSVGMYLRSSQTDVDLKARTDDIVTGILAICVPIIEERWLGDVWTTLPYLSISLSLNITLTLMIVVRLFLHERNIRTATGSPGGIGGVYKTISTMLIESSALFTVSSLLAIGSLARKSQLLDLAIQILGQTQVRISCDPDFRTGYLMYRLIGQAIAPLLIIQRVANKRALTKNSVAPGSTCKLKTGSQGESTGGSHSLPGRHSMGFVGEQGASANEFGVDTVIDIRLEKI